MGENCRDLDLCPHSMKPLVCLNLTLMATNSITKMRRIHRNISSSAQQPWLCIYLGVIPPNSIFFLNTSPK